MTHVMVCVALGVLVLNIPFGYWRAGAKKFSLRWFLGVHLPVPIVAAMRIFSGLGWKIHSFVVLIAAYALGQFTGAYLYRRRSRPKSE